MPPKKQQVKTTVVYKTINIKEVRKEYPSKPVKPVETKRSGACYRCGRTSHYASDCYAGTHSNGYVIDSDSE